MDWHYPAADYPIGKEPEMGKIVFFDLETGGLGMDAPIIQIAMQAVEDYTFEPCDAPLNILLKFDEATADLEALEKNHYSRERWDDEAVDTFVATRLVGNYLRGNATRQKRSAKGSPYSVAMLAGYNTESFDLPRLRKLFSQTFFPAEFRSIDILHLVYTYEVLFTHATADLRYSLGYVCERYGIANEKAHDALADVRATIALAREITHCIREGR